MANTNIFHKASVPLPEQSCNHRLCTVESISIRPAQVLTVRRKKIWFRFSGLLALQSYIQISEELPLQMWLTGPLLGKSDFRDKKLFLLSLLILVFDTSHKPNVKDYYENR